MTLPETTSTLEASSSATNLNEVPRTAAITVFAFMAKPSPFFNLPNVTKALPFSNVKITSSAPALTSELITTVVFSLTRIIPLFRYTRSMTEFAPVTIVSLIERIWPTAGALFPSFEVIATSPKKELMVTIVSTASFFEHAVSIKNNTKIILLYLMLFTPFNKIYHIHFASINSATNYLLQRKGRGETISAQFVYSIMPP